MRFLGLSSERVMENIKVIGYGIRGDIVEMVWKYQDNR